MNIKSLKFTILENSMVEFILESLGCHHIKLHHSSEYITCGNPDGGDNPQAVTIYLNDNLTCIDYTRHILPPEQSRTTDIFDFIVWAKGINFFEALKWVCETCGYDYYADEEEVPESLQLLRFLSEMTKGDKFEEEDNSPLKPIDEKILSYYIPYGNVLFERDNISLETQRVFEVAYDPQSNHIILPLRDECGTLVGVKGRIFQEHLYEGQSKYTHLVGCNKSRLLYNLDKAMNGITQAGRVFVGESEKFCMQLYDMGYWGVSTGGSKISKYQINMLVRLGVKIIFAYDKDIGEQQLEKIAEQFPDGVPVYAIIDKDEILSEKESPSDSPSKWLHLVQNNIYKIR